MCINSVCPKNLDKVGIIITDEEVEDRELAFDEAAQIQNCALTLQSCLSKRTRENKLMEDPDFVHGP